MLRVGRAVLMGVSFLALACAFWTLAGIGYGAWETVKATGLTPELSLSDLRIGVLFSVGFLVLSGYLITAPLLYAFYGGQRSWTLRALFNVGLFLLHVSVFALFVGSSPPGWAELPRILLGVAGVLAGEATVRLLWGRSGSGLASTEDEPHGDAIS